MCDVKFEDTAGGVLRDNEGTARALFSGSSDAKYADFTEVGAIKVALDLVESMGWTFRCPILVKVGSILVLNWLSIVELSPRKLQLLFVDIDNRR